MIKKIKIDRLKSKLDQNYMKIVIIDMIWSLKYESDQNRRSNLAGLESEWSTIQFGDPYRLSLQIIDKNVLTGGTLLYVIVKTI